LNTLPSGLRKVSAFGGSFSIVKLGLGKGIRAELHIRGDVCSGAIINRYDSSRHILCCLFFVKKNMLYRPNKTTLTTTTT